MAHFIRGTTPEFKITSDTTIDYDSLGTVIVRFKQGTTKIDKTPEVQSGIGYVSLTQAETLLFSVGFALYQLMAIKGKESVEYVPKSTIKKIEVRPSIWNKEVHNE